MKKQVLLLILLIIPITVQAQRGCCSSKGGVCGCSADGRAICCRGGYSPTCHCTPTYTPTPTPPVVNGCTDPNANNYNPNATNNDGSCTYTIKGCTDSKANNYNANANTDDGTCNYDVLGCTDKKAKNYNKLATKDDGSCIAVVKGCTDPEAYNFNENANTDNKSCKYEKDIPLDDLKEEIVEEKKEEVKEEVKEEKTIIEENNQTNISNSTSDTSLLDTGLGLLAASGAAGGYSIYQKTKQEKEKPKGIKKLLSLFKKKEKKKKGLFRWK